MLTVKAIGARAAGLHIDGDGLYLKVAPTGSRSWVFRYQLNRKRRYMGLGSYPMIGLAEARERAAAERRKLKVDGIDPVEERREQRKAAKIEAATAKTFRQCAEGYIADNKAGWKSLKSLAAWEGTLRDYAYPKIGDLNVADIDTPHVLSALRPIWHTKTETANRLRGRIESVLAWATAQGLRKGDHPATWRNHLDKLLPKPGKVAPIVHHRALSYREVGKFMAELSEQGGLAVQALRFTILTWARSGETLGATRSEIDWEAGTWTIPAKRMKAGREHVVPLSDTAMAILRALPEDREQLFPLSGMAMTMLLRRMERGDVTVHGFRSTARDWAGDRTSFPAEIAELALAHAVGDRVEQSYRRGTGFEKRRQLADAWSRYCAVVEKPAGNVVAING